MRVILDDGDGWMEWVVNKRMGDAVKAVLDNYCLPQRTGVGDLCDVDERLYAAEQRVKELEQDIERVRDSNGNLLRANTELCNEVDKLSDNIAFLRGPNYVPPQCAVLVAENDKLRKDVNDLHAAVNYQRDENDKLRAQRGAPAIIERVVYVPYAPTPCPAPWPTPWPTPYVVTCSQTAGGINIKG